MASLKNLQSRLHLASATALIGLLGPAVSAAPPPHQGETVVLASGPSQGVYHRLAERMRDRLGKQGINVRVVPKPDCAASLAWLEDEPEEGEVRFAFAQQDVVGERFRTTSTPTRVVGRIGYDYVHIFVRQNLDVQSIADLSRHKVWLGEEGSAVRFTAVRFLESVGVRPETVLRYQDLENVTWDAVDLNVEDRAVKELSNWLHAERIDAAILVAPIGSPEAPEILRRGGCRLLPLTHPFHRKLLSQPVKSPFLRYIALGEIPKWTYANQEQPVSAAAVSVLLLAPEGTNADLAKVVRQAAQDAEAALRPPIPEPEPLANPGLKWLEGLDSPEHSIPGHLRVGIVLSAILGAIGVGLWQQQRIRRGYRRVRRIRLVGDAFNLWYQFSLLIRVTVITIATSMLVITLMSWYVEREVNEHFSSLREAWWSITLYIFSGLDQARAPYTPLGRILGATGLVIGWLLSIILTGKTIEILIRRERKMPPRLKDHLVLLNWNKRGMEIVEQLHHTDLDGHEQTSVTVVLSDASSLGLQQFSCFPEVYLRIGNPTDEADLKKVNAHTARTIIVLSDEHRGDEWTIRSIIKLGKIVEAPRRLHVVVELSDPANRSILEDLAKSFPGHIEPVSEGQLRTQVIAQAVLIEGITDFYMDLLSVGGNNNEVYTVPLPDSADDWSFREYSVLVLEHTKASQNPVIPIGIHRKADKRYEIITNPQGVFKLQKGDRLLVIAYDPPKQDALPAPPPKPVPRPEKSTDGDLALSSQPAAQA